MKHLIVLALLVTAWIVLPGTAGAADIPDIQFFYSETCPHCLAEQGFLDVLAERYPELLIERLPARLPAARAVLEERLTQLNATRYLGVVPVTFVGERYFVGFDSPEGTGARIIEAVEALNDTQLPPPTRADSFMLPLIGTVDSAHYSLPALAVLLGTLDGFNVCSLGALVLILGMVLALQDRRRILVFGGAFLLTTAVIYGLLIVLWFKAFSFLAPLTGVLEIIVSLLALGGGAYFLWQWWRMRRYGPTCGFTGNRFVNWVTGNVQSRLTGAIRLIPAVVAILLFAAVITIVEFPCSAAVPVVFAGLLADSGLGIAGQLSLIALFVVFYLLDELIVFGIAVSRMRLWLTSPGVVVWATLAEGLILLGVAVWYVRALF